MCPDLWITSLLFDLIMNLLTEASLLALAKSIYYLYNDVNATRAVIGRCP